ncbi:MAG: NAD-dependent epimerase/dehydratase family protein [Syntrophobacteraceae bacterium]
MTNQEGAVLSLPGPILVIGASGFVGANLFRALLGQRQDVFGTVHIHKPWRLEGIPSSKCISLDLLFQSSQLDVLKRLRPALVFNCSAFGAYSFEDEVDRIHRTNYLTSINLMEICLRLGVQMYIHAGSSSEYGINCVGPTENDTLIPDSHYAVSKAATAQAIAYYGKVCRLPCVNLRLYSLYGPYEDSSRLIPTLAEHLLRGALPPLVSPDTSRDFVHIGDAVDAFVTVAADLKECHYGQSYNVGTGVRTTIRELVEMSRERFAVTEKPRFDSMSAKTWDHRDWYADPRRIHEDFGWRAEIQLREGFESTVAWWKDFLVGRDAESLTKKPSHRSNKNSISAVIACYKDEQAIPIMYRRLVDTFIALGLDYQIIFVNDASPDSSTEQIRALSEQDSRVIGIVHSRNFGSQAAFRSGMEISGKEACVLLDGDLQDPPEIIPAFVEKWRNGADVVYGRRVRREMPWWLERLYKGFYSIFSALSDIPIPKNAGDFSLLDSKVVRWLLRCPERDYFLRGLRAYVGFKQEGVDYIRPERPFGTSTNNLTKNIGWAKKAIFSFSRTPLNLLTALGTITTLVSVLLGLLTTAVKILAPTHVPHGLTTVILLILIFGSVNILGLGLLGEYIGKIVEETKKRPPFIRVERIERGEIFPWREEL